MLNRIFLMGRLVVDPDLKQTLGGVPVTTFRIAVDRDFKNKKTGERETDFLTIVAWRNTAEFVANNFTKGRMIVVVGRLQIRPYTDKEGNKRSATEIVAEDVYFADSRPGEQELTSQSAEYNAPANNAEFTEAQDNGELPF